MKHTPRCPKCRVPLREGQAIQQTWITGAPDFIGDVRPNIQTMSAGGPGKLISCLKCPECGWSVTGGA